MDLHGQLSAGAENNNFINDETKNNFIYWTTGVSGRTWAGEDWADRCVLRGGPVLWGHELQQAV